MSFEPTPAMMERTEERGPLVDFFGRVSVSAFVEHLATNPESMRAVADYAMRAKFYDRYEGTLERSTDREDQGEWVYSINDGKQ